MTHRWYDSSAASKAKKMKECRQKIWCSLCRSDTHKDTTRRRKDKQDGVSKVSGDTDEDYTFKIRDEGTYIQ